jgi:multisubunit Na+/H+ antiporter MnhB subunit
VAGLAILMAFALRNSPAAAAGTGLALGWLTMTYPTGALLGITIWLSILVYKVRTTSFQWGRVITHLLIAGAALIATIGVFWLAGRYLFPGLDWWQTFVQASGQDHSVLGSGQWVWLRDISLLVPASTLVVAIANRLRARGKQPADLALIISSSSVAFYLVFAPVFGAQFLEAPLHQVLIWAPTLTAIVLVATSRMPDSPSRNPTLIALAGFALTAIIVSGSVAPDFGFVLGMVIAIGTTAVLLAAPQRTISTLLAVALFLLGAQLLQNSRPQLGNFMLDPYYWAYTGNPNEAKLRAAVNAQRWLIDNTVPEDRLLLWVDGPWREGDRELYSVAAMQLWGENRVTLESTFTDDYGLEKIKVVRPTALVLYGKSMDAVWAFWNSVPKQLDPSPPKCYDFTWPEDPTSAFPTAVGHTCIVRLTKEP